MDENKAREILEGFIQADDTLGSLSYMRWDGRFAVILNGGFSADTLEALVWWMRNKAKSDQS